MKKSIIFLTLLFIISGIILVAQNSYAQTTATSTSRNNPCKVTTITTFIKGEPGKFQNYCCEKGGQTVVVPQCIVGGLFDGNDPEDVKCACCGDCSLAHITKTAVKVSQRILWLSGSLALAVFIYGGLLWVISGGSPDKVEKGKKALTAAVIGVIIVLGAYLLIDFTVRILTGKNLQEIQKGDWGTK